MTCDDQPPILAFSVTAQRETTLPKFLDIHDGFFGTTAAELQAAHDADLAIEADEGVHFERAWLDPDSGKIFCLSSGPSKEAVMRIHQRAGHPTGQVYALTVEV